MKNGFGQGGGFLRPGAGLLIGLLLAAAAGFFSPAKSGGMQGETQKSEKIAEGRESMGDEDPAEDSDGIREIERFWESHRRLFDCLYSSMQAGDLTLAAACLEENRDEIAQVICRTSGKGSWLYDGTRFSENPEGRGIVLQSPSTVFYGTFRNGMPEGYVTALRSIVLDGPRYDYSIGRWSAGRMNGFGVTGYTYYGGAGQADGFRTEKAGQFAGDRMEGRVSYISIDRTGDSFTWQFEARGGVTVLDKRWKYQKSDGQFHLPAENDKTHVYLLDEEDKDQVLWQNRINWPD